MIYPENWGTHTRCRLSKYVELSYEHITNLNAPIYTNKLVRKTWSEAIVYLSGDVEYHTVDATWVPAPLDIFTVDTNELFSIDWGQTEPLEQYILAFDNTLFDELLGNNRNLHDVMMDFLDHRRHPNLLKLTDPLKDELTDILNTADPLLGRNSEESVNISALVQITRLFELLYNTGTVDRSTMASDTLSPMTTQAMQFVNDSFLTLTGLKEAADRLHVSPEYLSKRFRQETGVSFNSYLLEKKLHYSRRRLRLGRNVTEAAADAGFTNVSYFIQLYKKHFGVTPGKKR